MFLAATEAAASPLHIPSVGPVTGTMALVVAGILIWRGWLFRIAALLLVVAGAGLAYSWLGGPANRLMSAGPSWMKAAPWAFGLVMTVFLVVELLPTKRHRGEMLAKAKKFHHFDWVHRGPIEKPAVLAVSFVYVLFAGAIPGKAGGAVSTVVNAITSPLTSGLHSAFGVS